jgi:uncharacterized damage-inducible protein DinB
MKNTIIELLQKELEQEAITTRKMLSIVPADKFDWKPHPKSMNVKMLATHIAEIPSWVSLAVNTDELDFGAEPYQASPVSNAADLVALFDKNFESAGKDLQKLTEPLLDKMWTMRNGDDIYGTQSKYETIRHSYCQMVHHRAQLGVFLRLLNVPIPGSYGPSADEMNQ